MSLWSIHPRHLVVFAIAALRSVTAFAGDTDSTAVAAPATVERQQTPDQPVTLRYKYTAGDTLRYEVVDESTLNIDQGAGQAMINYSTQTWKHFDIKTVSEGGRAVMQLTLDRVQMEATGPDGSSTFDSQQPGVPPAEYAAVLNRIGRPTLEMTVDATGHVTGLREPGKPATRETTLPTELLERDSSASVVLPDEAVRIGSTWTELVEVPVSVDEGRLQQRVDLKRTYTLTAIEENIATIELDTIVLTPIQETAISVQLIQRTPSGIILFDMDQGRVVSKRTLVNNQVVGHEGAGSRLKVARSYVERLVTENESTVSQPAETVSAIR